VDFEDLPALNALLNFTSGVLVTLGVYLVYKRKTAAHRVCMVSAVVVSSIFLTSYLIYHYQVGSVRFDREGWIRTVYLSILLTHTVLAVVIVPMVLRTVYLAFRGQLEKHRRIARWTFPVWLYVSFTGVVVYLMLYQL
jgi:uncharacterized membrane protein YozB (DUF420 family)